MRRIPPGVLEGALLADGSAAPAARLLATDERPIGIGAATDTLLVTLEWDPPGSGPGRLVAKLPSADEVAARTAASLGLCEREARFYADLGPRTGVNLPYCYGSVDVGAAAPAVLLADLSASHRPIDQLSEVPLPVVRAALAELAALQSCAWQDETAARLPWLHRRLGVPIPAIHERMQRSWAAVRDDLTAVFDARERDVVDRFVPAADAWARSLDGPFSLVHHDFRVDNMLLAAGRPVVLDWQTVGWGAPMFDVAYLLTTSLEPATRRAVEAAEVTAHLDALAARGVQWDREEAWTAYRRAAFAVLLMLVPAAGSVKQDSRTRTMLRRLVRHGARAVLDLDALELLPEA